MENTGWLRFGRVFVLYREKELKRLCHIFPAIFERQGRRHQARGLGRAWHIVVGELRQGRMTNIEGGEGRPAVGESANRGRMGNKDVVQQRREYENGKRSHGNTIEEKKDPVNAKLFMAAPSAMLLQTRKSNLTSRNRALSPRCKMIHVLNLRTSAKSVDKKASSKKSYC